MGDLDPNVEYDEVYNLFHRKTKPSGLKGEAPPAEETLQAKVEQKEYVSSTLFSSATFF